MLREIVAKGYVAQTNPVDIFFYEFRFGESGEEVGTSLRRHLDSVHRWAFRVFTSIAEYPVEDVWLVAIAHSCAQTIAEQEHFGSVEYVATFADIEQEREVEVADSKLVGKAQGEIRVPVADWQEVGVHDREAGVGANQYFAVVVAQVAIAADGCCRAHTALVARQVDGRVEALEITYERAGAGVAIQPGIRVIEFGLVSGEIVHIRFEGSEVGQQLPSELLRFDGSEVELDFVAIVAESTSIYETEDEAGTIAQTLCYDLVEAGVFEVGKIHTDAIFEKFEFGTYFESFGAFGFQAWVTAVEIVEESTAGRCLRNQARLDSIRGCIFTRLGNRTAEFAIGEHGVVAQAGELGKYEAQTVRRIEEGAVGNG